MLEIFIDKQEKQEKVALVENGNLVEYYEEDENTDRKEGNIYVGTVKDILPKIDERKESLEPNIEIGKVIKPNQKLLVQIKKDSNDKKGARVSTHINLPGKYIVLMPNTSFITVSQKIEDKAEQERLINLVKKYIGKENGAIIRTSAVKKEKELIHDIEDLERKWKKIREKYEQVVKQNNKESLIYEAENILEKMIIDLSNEKIENIVTNDEKKYAQLLDEKSKSDELVNTKIILENKDVLDIYDIKKQLEKLPNRKIWLKCGGFITIDKTEALTAIDVNTGKYTGNRNLEQTLYKVNEEATVEIAKQLRLRDIGGIIIIDYIDMKKQENKDKIQKLLEQRLKFDRAKTQVEGFTKLDLMEMTRKHICSHKDRKENI